jgi:hypothetical protein
MDAWHGVPVGLRAPAPGDAPVMRARQRDGEGGRLEEDIRCPRGFAAIAARMAAPRAGDEVSPVIAGPGGRRSVGRWITPAPPRRPVTAEGSDPANPDGGIRP